MDALNHVHAPRVVGAVIDVALECLGLVVKDGGHIAVYVLLFPFRSRLNVPGFWERIIKPALVFLAGEPVQYVGICLFLMQGTAQVLHGKVTLQVVLIPPWALESVS